MIGRRGVRETASLSVGSKTLGSRCAGAQPCLSQFFYCTFASTCEFAFKVMAQVLALLPPLEHAPDQMASRPLETESVMELPGANAATCELPTATLIPEGVEVMNSPLRPPATT